jgi:hypothetical protein
MLQYSVSRSRRQNKKIERNSKVEGKYHGWIDQYDREYNDEYDKEAKTDAESAFMQRVETQKAGFWALIKAQQAVDAASVYKKDDFEEILSESEGDNFSEEESEYEPSDSEDDYSEYDQLETESVSTDSVEEDYENLSDEYLSDGDSDYDPETDSYEYSDSMESDLESVDDLENIEDEYEKTFTNLEMNAIVENLELNRKKDIVDMMFLTSMLILMIICGFTCISLMKTH